jgi:pimeloyl-ACP methyl ester carboxylesterase
MRSSEMMIDVGHGISLCYERLGDPQDPPIVLIMGLGQQLLAWPDELCDGLLDRGFQLVRFDNRDIGHSTHSTVGPPRFKELMIRNFDPEQYTLADMAADVAGLIDGLDLRPAHIVGVSMGGMIAQTLAARHSTHVRSLASIISSTGSRRVGWVAPTTLRLMFRPPPRDREAAADRASTIWRHVGSTGFAFDEEAVRSRARIAFDRDPRGAAGTARQMAAILKSGDRTPELRGITVPTVVIHGDRDLLVHPSGGRATARAIPGARLATIAGLGHDLPAGAMPQLVSLIADNAAQADRSGTPAPA